MRRVGNGASWKPGCVIPSEVDIGIDFTLQELAEHFVIPEVPDTAAVDPEGFQRELRFLEELERFLSA